MTVSLIQAELLMQLHYKVTCTSTLCLKKHPKHFWL